jgi:sarcosine oxidase subunit gamma
MFKVLQPCTIIRVQSWELNCAIPAIADEAVGGAWPTAVGTTVRGKADVLCVGPTDWLVIAGDAHAESVLQLLRDGFRESALRATDLSSALTRVQVEGAQARELLSRGCSLDLHPTTFSPGRVARTRFAGMPVAIRCTELTTFECIVSSSYRDYLMSWFADAGHVHSGHTSSPERSSGKR